MRILAVGKVKSPEYTALATRYLARIRPWAPVEVMELKDQDPEREGRAMVERIGTGDLVVALDERGEELTSRGFADLLGSHGSLTFLIGGPDGLGVAARGRADRTLRLSAMTLPHELARVVLVEQIYRGLAIRRGHKYHRD
ncbi:23S rRNA (pseudouridine(1915)-N(3))-methyltransferase RlmH [bacterium]|nr:23S rRNA (pseudouridine(1915)-N(3))-methyltransferase RlmH [bacterium]